MRVGMVIVAGFLTLTAPAQDHTAALVIELHNPQAPFAAIALAEATARRIYADIGVGLQFRMGSSHSQSRNVAIGFDTGARSEFHAGALAYSEPYATSGVGIHILLDRVRQAGSDPPMGVLLGHVIAHEVGHILEGNGWHSPEGIMKAHWSHTDLEKMAAVPLSFDRDDIESIRAGVSRRTSSPKIAETSSFRLCVCRK
jgi:hypothetical protein